MNYNFKFFKYLLVVDFVLILISLLFFSTNTLLNTQIAYISSSLVMFASMLSYRRMVENRVASGMVIEDDNRDEIDKLEDPYDLYSEDIIEDAEVDIKEAIKEEKLKMKNSKRTISQTIKDTKAALSFYRIFSYVILVVGFLYLNRHGLLEVSTYIVSLSIPIIVLVTILTNNKE